MRTGYVPMGSPIMKMGLRDEGPTEPFAKNKNSLRPLFCIGAVTQFTRPLYDEDTPTPP